mmetsp:Transcript_15762/g.34101  ORF Transcript_15762/g.34101 Transcript_15762/m.34101 type:complete len:272 (-) Transcript_15762:1269-2084(-)
MRSPELRVISDVVLVVSSLVRLAEPVVIQQLSRRDRVGRGVVKLHDNHAHRDLIKLNGPQHTQLRAGHVNTKHVHVTQSNLSQQLPQWLARNVSRLRARPMLRVFLFALLRKLCAGAGCLAVSEERKHAVLAQLFIRDCFRNQPRVRAQALLARHELFELIGLRLDQHAGPVEMFFEEERVRFVPPVVSTHLHKHAVPQRLRLTEKRPKHHAVRLKMIAAMTVELILVEPVILLRQNLRWWFWWRCCSLRFASTQHSSASNTRVRRLSVNA